MSCKPCALMLFILTALMLFSVSAEAKGTCVVQITDYRGQVTYKLVGSDKIKDEEKKITARAAEVREAFLKAVALWKETNDEDFPLKTYVVPGFRKLETYINKKSAEATLKKLNAKLAKDRNFRTATEKMNLARMPEKKRERYLKQKADMEKGFSLLAQQLNPKAAKKPAAEKKKKPAEEKKAPAKEGEAVEEQPQPEANQEVTDSI